MGALDWRRAARREIERLTDLHQRVDDRVAALRLERDRLARLGFDLPCLALLEAVDHLDSAILCAGEAHHHLESKQ
jgi:hypothetical protein